MSTVTATPATVSIKKTGGSAKTTLKNPLKEKFIARILLSDPNEYYVEVQPCLELAMGESLPIEVFRMKEATSTSQATIRFRIFKHSPKFPDVEISQLEKLYDVDVKIDIV